MESAMRAQNWSTVPEDDQHQVHFVSNSLAVCSFVLYICIYVQHDWQNWDQFYFDFFISPNFGYFMHLRSNSQYILFGCDATQWNILQACETGLLK